MNRSDEILQATLQLIPQHGLGGIRISHIAQQADCSPGIIYHYFASKDEIIRTLGATVMAQFGRSLDMDHLETLAPFDRLKQAWLNTFHFFVNHPDETLFLEQYKNSPYYDGEVKDENMIRLIQVVSKDVSQGHLKNFPIEVMYEMTMTVATALAKQVVRGQLTLDKAMVEAIATASCQALMAT